MNGIQAAIQDLSKGYIERTYDLLGDHSSSDPSGPGRLFGERGATPAAEKAPENPKKKKRAPVDPNAPKRPITAYFLYMKTHRPIIQAEMGPGHTAKEVADEGTRRWNAKSKEDQHVSTPYGIQGRLLHIDSRSQVWRLRYWINRAAYKVKLQAYKEGKPIPEISEEAAKKLFEEQSKNGQPIEDAASDDEDAAVDEEQAAADSSSDESESEEDPEPIKEPSPPKPNKRQKTSKAAPEKKAAKAKTPVAREQSPTPAPASPVKSAAKDKKAKSSRKSAAKEPEPVVEPKSTPSAKKEKAAKKKRKSEAMEE